MCAHRNCVSKPNIYDYAISFTHTRATRTYHFFYDVKENHMRDTTQTILYLLLHWAMQPKS